MTKAYEAAKKAGRFADTYAMENEQAYDPAAYALVDELLSDKVSWQDCYRDD